MSESKEIKPAKTGLEYQKLNIDRKDEELIREREIQKLLDSGEAIEQEIHDSEGNPLGKHRIVDRQGNVLYYIDIAELKKLHSRKEYGEKNAIMPSEMIEISPTDDLLFHELPGEKEGKGN